MQKRISLADSEWILMQTIWENPGCTFRGICDAVCAPQGWSKHVVSSYLKRMEAKGAILAEEAKPVKRYRPLLDRENALREETEELLSRVYNGSPLLMIQAAVQAKDLSEEELDALELLLKEGRERRA